MTPTVSAAAARPRWVDPVLLLVVLVWGGNFIVMKLAYRGIDRDIFNGARYLVAAGIAVPIALRAGLPRLSRRGWTLVLATALVGNVLYQWIFAAGVDLTSAGKASVLLSTAPLWVAVMRRLRGERVAPGAWVGLGLAVVGVAGLMGDRGGSGTLAGDLVMLAAAMLWAASMVMSRPAVAVAGEQPFHGVAMLVGAIGLVTIALPSVSMEMLRPLGTGPGLFALAYSGALSIGIGFFAWTAAIRHAGPMHVANFQNLVPVVALAAEAVFLPETAVGGRQWIAAATVIVGVTIARRAGAAPRAARGPVAT